MLINGSLKQLMEMETVLKRRNKITRVQEVLERIGARLVAILIFGAVLNWCWDYLVMSIFPKAVAEGYVSGDITYFQACVLCLLVLHPFMVVSDRLTIVLDLLRKS